MRARWTTITFFTPTFDRLVIFRDETNRYDNSCDSIAVYDPTRSSHTWAGGGPWS